MKIVDISTPRFLSPLLEDGPAERLAPRPGPTLHRGPGARMYGRHGTTNLYAALGTASGQVITDLTARHRAAEFQRFLNLISRQVPDELAVHVIVDNSSTHGGEFEHPSKLGRTQLYSLWGRLGPKRWPQIDKIVAEYTQLEKGR